MTLTQYVSPVVAKELRELGPLWLVILACIALPRLLVGDSPFSIIAGVLYAIGGVALGAMSMGHEYRHRTLSVLLSQPASRGRILVVKMGVLAALLGALGVAAWMAWFAVADAPGTGSYDGFTEWLLLPLVCGLFVAPWMTMLCRSEFGGLVFAIVAPVFLFRTLGPASGGVVLWMSAIGAAGTIWTFHRLQIEGPGVVLRRPEWLRLDSIVPVRRHRSRRLNPYVALADKELHLHGWTFLTAALLAAACIVLPMPVQPYMVIVVILSGAASAEERHLGMIASQSRLPMASWKPWAVRVAVAVGLIVVLGFAVPALLEWFRGTPWLRRRMWTREVVGAMLGLAAVALYVSSIATGRIRAFLATIGAIVVLAGLWRVWSYTWSDPLQVGSPQWFAVQFESVLVEYDLTMNAATLRHVISWLPWLLAGLLALVLLSFARVNDRSIEYNGAAVRRQLGWLAAGFLTALMIHSAAGGLLAAAARTGRLRDMVITAPLERRRVPDGEWLGVTLMSRAHRVASEDHLGR